MWCSIILEQRGWNTPRSFFLSFNFEIMEENLQKKFIEHIDNFLIELKLFINMK